MREVCMHCHERLCACVSVSSVYTIALCALSAAPSLSISMREVTCVCTSAHDRMNKRTYGTTRDAQHYPWSHMGAHITRAHIASHIDNNVWPCGGWNLLKHVSLRVEIQLSNIPVCTVRQPYIVTPPLRVCGVLTQAALWKIELLGQKENKILLYVADSVLLC